MDDNEQNEEGQHLQEEQEEQEEQDQEVQEEQEQQQEEWQEGDSAFVQEHQQDDEVQQAQEEPGQDPVFTAIHAFYNRNTIILNDALDHQSGVGIIVKRITETEDSLRRITSEFTDKTIDKHYRIKQLGAIVKQMKDTDFP